MGRAGVAVGAQSPMVGVIVPRYAHPGELAALTITYDAARCDVSQPRAGTAVTTSTATVQAPHAVGVTIQ
jgi:hypothetical protein